jgi:hypothetical protein
LDASAGLSFSAGQATAQTVSCPDLCDSDDAKDNREPVDLLLPVTYD